MPRNQWFFFLFFAATAIAGCGLLVGCSDDDTGGPGSGAVATSGDIYIRTDPAVLGISWTLAMPGGYTQSGVGNALFESMDPGEYTVSWSKIEGWTGPLPNPLTKTLVAGTQLDFLGIYFAEPGTIFLDVIPDGFPAPWTVEYAADGETYSYLADGTGQSVLAKCNTGLYRVIWGEVPGWVVDPNTVEFEMTLYGVNLPVEYVQDVESIFLNPEPGLLNAPWSISGPSGFSKSGEGEITFTESAPDESLANGDYTVTWNALDGYTTPAAETLAMEPGAILVFQGDYAAETGTGVVEVLPAGLEAAWLFAGSDQAGLPGAGTTQFTNLLPGDYSVFWHDVAGWITPAPTDGTVPSGGSETFSGTYEPTIHLDVEPDGLDASWTMAGPGGFSQPGNGDWTFSGLAAGDYTVTFGAVSGWDAPAAAAVSLGSQGTVVEGAYVQHTMTIFVDPRPVGTNAGWRVQGPGGFDHTGTGFTTLTATAAGSYTITWGEMDDLLAPAKQLQILDDSGSVTFSDTYLHALEMVAIEGDQFDMGSPRNEGCAAGDETQHIVVLDQAFRMMTTEVTNRQYVEVAQWAVDQGHAVVEGGYVRDNLDGSVQTLLDLNDAQQRITYSDGVFACTDPDLPVIELNWYGAAAFCDWLSLHEGKIRAYNHSNWQCNEFDPYTAFGYRLPTEAEWEFACRAGTVEAFANGDITEDPYTGICTTDALGDICWFGENSGARIHQVAWLITNLWDLYDMHGNVAEWCNDWYRSDYYTRHDVAIPHHNPPGPSSGEDKVVRGGHFFNTLDRCRSASRFSEPIGDFNGLVGFRVVITN